MLPPHKKRSIILHLCRSKIAWDNYAPLQMISEYFPACGRSPKLCKKAEFFRNSNTPETSSSHIECW